MLFVATLSIYLVCRERSILVFVYVCLCARAIYWIFQLMRKNIHKRKINIMARANDANAICSFCFFKFLVECRGFNWVRMHQRVPTKRSKPTIDCDLSMSIYNEKLSICAWHVGILYVQFHKWWNSVADVNKCAVLHACAHTKKWGVVVVVVVASFSMIFYIRNAFTLETFKNYQLISCVCFIFVGILHDHIQLFGSGLLFSEHLVTEQ